jgi:pyridoxal 5-phosphate dependent beta-lyase
MSVSQWVQDRVPTDRVHLDVAAAGRVSQAVLDAEVAHLRAEAELGAYVAEAAAEPAVTAGREALGALVGLGGDDVLLTDGAATAFAVLLDAWPLGAGARVGTVPSEYGGNARVLRSRAVAHGWELVPLPVDDLGRVTGVPDGLDLVTFPQVPSQRGIAQPVAEVLAAGVPLVLDVAQAVGQVEVPAGAAGYVGTSRKWLCGPRGVGFAVVDPAWHDRLAEPATLGGLDRTGLGRFDSTEPHVAGRVGLALAARSWSPALLPVVAAAAAAARVLLEGAGGWEVVEPVAEPTGITTLRHPSANPARTRLALVDEGFVVSAVPTTRAADLAVPVLRVSTAAWATPGDLEALAAALERCTQ